MTSSETDHRQRLTGLILLLALASIVSALAFEHIGGYRPCPLCLTQRYAYYFGVPAALLALLAVRAGWRLPATLLIAAIGLAFFANAGLGVYHSGVEWHWWQGPTGCSGGGSIATGAGGLLGAIAEADVVRCDEAQLRILGLSFAGWSAVVSILIAVLSLQAIRAPRSNY